MYWYCRYIPGIMHAVRFLLCLLRLRIDQFYPYTTALLGQPYHGDVIKWKRCPRYWSFVRGIHRSPVNSPHKGQWRGSLIFSLICGWINAWINNRDDGDSRPNRGHYDVTLMWFPISANEANLKMMCIYTTSQQHKRILWLKQNNTNQKRVHIWWHNEGRKSGFQVGDFYIFSGLY